MKRTEHAELNFIAACTSNFDLMNSWIYVTITIISVIRITSEAPCIEKPTCAVTSQSFVPCRLQCTNNEYAFHHHNVVLHAAFESTALNIFIFNAIPEKYPQDIRSTQKNKFLMMSWNKENPSHRSFSERMTARL